MQGQSALDLRRPATVEGCEQQLLAFGRGFDQRVVDARIVGDMGTLPMSSEDDQPRSVMSEPSTEDTDFGSRPSLPDPE